MKTEAVTLYLPQLPAQTVPGTLTGTKTIRKRLYARVRTSTGEGLYRLEDGRRCRESGVPHPWDLWRLYEPDCRRIAREAQNDGL